MTPLRKRMIESRDLRGVAPKTLKIYVDCTARFFDNGNPCGSARLPSVQILLSHPALLEMNPKRGICSRSRLKTGDRRIPSTAAPPVACKSLDLVAY